jgi:hypothetical protein
LEVKKNNFIKKALRVTKNDRASTRGLRVGDDYSIAHIIDWVYNRGILKMATVPE